MDEKDTALWLRAALVKVALEWEAHFGVGPSITTAISELDAALLVSMPIKVYRSDGKLKTAVTKDVDFVHDDIRYQVTANRPSGKKGSVVTLVKRKNEDKGPFGWNRLIWILYDQNYVMQEAWEFTSDEYRAAFGSRKRLSPDDMRRGRQLEPGYLLPRPFPIT